jgi:hypothetical protein
MTLSRKISLVSWMILSFSLLLCHNSFSGDWEFLKPVEGKKSTLKIKQDKRSYWKLSKKRSVTVEVVGPAELKVISRAILPEQTKEVIYGFATKRDNKKRYLTGRATFLSKSVSNPKKKEERIGEARSIVFDVPKGEHKYSFKLPKYADTGVYIRPMVMSKQATNTQYIAYLPKNYTEEARITVKEKEYIYYKIQNGQTIDLEVIGPTRIKAVSRLEFDNTMRGDKTYRVQVRNGSERVIFTKPFNGEISATASYVEPLDKTLGKGNTFYIDVPKGKHTFSVTTPDEGTSVLFRFYLPQSDLGNVIPTAGANRATLGEMVNSVVG